MMGSQEGEKVSRCHLRALGENGGGHLLAILLTYLP